MHLDKIPDDPPDTADVATDAERALARLRTLARQEDELHSLVDDAIADALTADPPASIGQVARALRRSKSAAYGRWLRIQRGGADNHARPGVEPNGDDDSTIHP